MPLSQIVSASIEDGAVAPVDLSSVAQYTGFKNRIINGAMVIDQRRAGAVVTPTNASYTLDRWGAYAFGSATGKFTVQQNAGAVTPPTGFTNYLGVTSTSAYSVAAGDITSIYQVIEGYNIADLGFGTASAATFTVSFWVRSSLTGTFGGSLRNGSATRSYPFTYTISAANTWEQKSVTVAGDTTGTWTTNNGQGLFLIFSLGTGTTYSGTAGAWAVTDLYSATGTVSVVGTNAATWYITGVQIEKGVTATSFDYRPYTTELLLCQRYFTIFRGDASNTPGVGAGTNWQSTTSYFVVALPSSMRVPPTVGYSAVSDMVVYSNGGSRAGTSVQSAGAVGLNVSEVYITYASALTAGYGAWFRVAQSVSAYLSFSSEL